jgi:hypothetical protein
VSIWHAEHLQVGPRTEPDELLVNHLMRRNIQSHEELRGQRGHRQVQAATRRLGRPNTMPNTMAHSPPRSSAGSAACRQMRMKKL